MPSYNRYEDVVRAHPAFLDSLYLSASPCTEALSTTSVTTSPRPTDSPPIRRRRIRVAPPTPTPDTVVPSEDTTHLFVEQDNFGIDNSKVEPFLRSVLHDNMPSRDTGSHYYLDEYVSMLEDAGKLCMLIIGPRSCYFQRQAINERDLIRYYVTDNIHNIYDDVDAFCNGITFNDGYRNNYSPNDILLVPVPDSLMTFFDETLPKTIACHSCKENIALAHTKLEDKDYYECTSCGTIHIVGEGVLYA